MSAVVTFVNVDPTHILVSFILAAILWSGAALCIIFPPVTKGAKAQTFLGLLMAGVLPMLFTIALFTSPPQRPTPYHAPHCVVVHDYRYCGGTKQ